MPVRRIVIYGDPVLRKQAEPVIEIDDTLKELIADMIETMVEAEGIGLAAPQVGESVAVCVVNMELIDQTLEPKAFINPVVLDDAGQISMEEGCLSIPEIRDDILRPESITVTYQDEAGVEHTEKCEGMLARVLQHEIDHLNGILFIDRLGPMKRKLLTKKLRKLAEESSSGVFMP